MSRIIQIPLNTFSRIFPNVDSNTTLICCTDKVCKLPMNSGEISLDTKFTVTIEGVLHTVYASLFMGHLAYFIEEVK